PSRLAHRRLPSFPTRRSSDLRDGRIASVGPVDATLSAAREVEFDSDVVVLPGIVDSHVHVCEPGNADWEGFATATKAAAAGGITDRKSTRLNSSHVAISYAVF